MDEEIISTTRVPAPALGSREVFLVRTYAHLLGAVLAFVALEVAYFRTGIAYRIAVALLSVNWLLVLGAFVLVSWLAREMASRVEGRSLQYAGLGLYVAAESIIFAPLLYVADHYAPGSIRSAAILTVMGFVGLSVIAFVSRKDFSFLRGLLQWAGVVAIVAIVGAVLFGAVLGTWFSVAMVGLAGVAILFDTSAILRSFPEGRHVGAALELFASVALLFWYMVRLLTGSRS